ncbi:MAG TPA: TIGR03619 family F420-dependent LLM class oxidoreductase [Candidatus Binataceae bacterium]|nr:TIGR03619 family F420-dependent LLM class oxidoreductase [Candidatus Binataceae bacterium]
MKYGVSIIPNTAIMPITELAAAVEQRGLDALFMGEHIHIPVKPRVAYPLPTMSAEYLRELDLVVALASAAAVTRRIKLASGVCLVTAHDPIILAKQFASLDVLSGGRIIIGVGTGWVSEIETHGTAFEDRWHVFKERIEAMKAIWTQEQAEYHGRFVNFDPIFCPPKPVQKPYPPLLLGVANPVNQHIDYLDGWFPPRMPLDQFVAIRNKLAHRMEAKSRDPRSIRITVHQNFPERCFDTEMKAIDTFGQAGVERIVYRLTGLPPDLIMPRLDELARLAH